MPSVLIVDDHLLVRQGLKQTLGEEYRDLFIGDARNSEEALNWLAKRRWDIVILDIALPGKDGFYVLEEIHRNRPYTRVLVLSMHADAQYAVRSRQMGAHGYVCKNAGRADLLKAIKNVLAGKEHFDCLSTVAMEELAPKRPELSARERAVLMAVVVGKRPTEIAADLNLSVKTVSTYKRRILNKLQINSTAELIRYVIDQRLS